MFGKNKIIPSTSVVAFQLHFCSRVTILFITYSNTRVIAKQDSIFKTDLVFRNVRPESTPLFASFFFIINPSVT